ncbi:LacI family DNA-binding transcriptional regulator [Bifidobacterium aquikefiri]|uniref:LacI family DNA-binding transcriptional regulator n=1 Tax=Bifidobacterium aquikefiri TaxID=1653207 RepID=UPI0039EC6D1C
MKNATVEDVAKAAGVSTFTVSRALRDMKHVAPETRARVLEAAESLNYSASKSAVALASGQTRRIALLSRETLSGWFMGELTDGIYDVVASKHYDLMVYRVGSQAEREQFFTRLPTNKNADGLIISGFSATESEQKLLTNMGLPIVLVNVATTDYSQGSASIDDIAAEESVIRYLSALGHKNFCYFGRVDPLSSHQWGSDSRVLGYSKAILELGLNDLGIYRIQPNDNNAIRRILATILSNSQLPTAICAWSDLIAIALIHELQDLSIRVPEDISVMGFDGSDVSSGSGLSTVKQPAKEIGHLAASKIIQLINGQPLDMPHTVVPCSIEPSETTGPAHNKRGKS